MEFAIRGYSADGKSVVGFYGLRKRKDIYAAREEVQRVPGVVQFKLLFRCGDGCSVRPF